MTVYDPHARCSPHGMRTLGRDWGPLVARLSRYLPLSEEEANALVDLTRTRRRFDARSDIVTEGDATRPPFVVLDGLACLYRVMSDGRRQILSFIVPGDICDLHSVLLKRSEDSIGTLAPTSIGVIKRERLLQVGAQYPHIKAALRWSSLQDEAILREHIVALGRRNARGRVAYVLCELIWRQSANGLVERDGEPGDSIHLPITQSDVADMLGLTPVHVNRVLQQFRKERLIVLDRHRLTLLDIERLQDIAELTPRYLHLDGAPAQTMLE